MAPAAPRPFGDWFEAHVGSMCSFYQSGEYANGLVVTGVEINLHAIELTRSRGQRRVDGVGRPKLDIQVVTDARTLRSRPRAFWEGLLAQLSTDNVRVRAEIVASTSTPSTRRLHGRVVAAT